MLSKQQIADASSLLDDIDIAMTISVIRSCPKYLANPIYFENIEQVLSDADGTVKARQVKAALQAIEKLGTGMVEIDQRKVSSTSGLYYSQVLERNSLAEYILTVLYPEFVESSTVTTDASGNVIGGYNYMTGQREV